MLFHGPNLVSCKIISGGQHTLLIGAYLPLSNIDHLLNLEEAVNRFQWRDSISIWDLNADIGRLQNPRIQQVADFLEYFGIVDILSHYRNRLRFCLMKTWFQVRQGIFFIHATITPLGQNSGCLRQWG